MTNWDTIRENAPPMTTSKTPIDVDVVARRCVYVNNYRIAGSKPYVSENLPSHALKTTIGEVLDAFTEKQIRAALREKKAQRDYYAVVHAGIAASAERNPKGQDAQQGLAGTESGAVPSETSADAQTTEDEIGNATSGNPLPVKGA